MNSLSCCVKQNLSSKENKASQEKKQKLELSFFSVGSKYFVKQHIAEFEYKKYNLCVYSPNVIPQLRNILNITFSFPF